MTLLLIPVPQPQDVTEQQRDLAMATGVWAGQTTGQVHLQSSDPGKAIATYCVQVLDPCVHSIKHFSALGGGLWTGIDCGTKPSLRKREVRSIIYLIDFFFLCALLSSKLGKLDFILHLVPCTAEQSCYGSPRNVQKGTLISL